MTAYLINFDVEYRQLEVGDSLDSSVLGYLPLDVSLVKPKALFCLVSVVWRRKCVSLVRPVRPNVANFVE